MLLSLVEAHLACTSVSLETVAFRSATTRLTGCTLLESRQLLVHTSQKPGQIDHDALMGSRANDFRIVPALYFELKFPALYCNEFYLGHNIHPHRCRRDVTNVDVSSDGALTRRQMRAQGFDARPFDISNHESGRKDRWHIPEAAERLGYRRNDQ